MVKLIMRKRFFKILTSLFAVTALIPPSLVRAAADDWIDFDPIINNIFIGIPYLIGSVGSWVFQLAAALVNFAYETNIEIMGDQFGVIQDGFATTLSIANLGFVIALILIAFATILQVETFSMNKLLPKLIIAAILINFSLLIVGLFLDLSHVLTNFFLSNLSGGGEALGDNLARSIDLSSILIPPNSAALTGGVVLFSEGWVAIFVSAIFMALFTWALAIAVAAVGVMFLLRYVTLIVLIIIMPIAWISPLIPVSYFSSINGTWWNKFLGQIFFLPVIGFFLLLAIQGASKLGSAIQDQLSGVEALNRMQTAFTTGGFGSLLPLFLQMMVFLFLIGAGIKVGASIGGEAGAIGASFANKANKKLTGMARGGTRRLATGTAGAAGSALTPAYRRTATGLSNTLLKVPWVPFAGGVANRLAGSGNKASEAQKKKAASRIENLTSPAQLDGLAKKGPEMGTENKAAFLKHFVDNKALDKLTVTKLDTDGKTTVVDEEATMKRLAPLVEAMKALNPDKDPSQIDELRALAATVPGLAPQITGQSTRQAISSAKPDELSDASITEFSDLFSQRQLQAVAQKGDTQEMLVNMALTKQLGKLTDKKMDPAVLASLNSINAQLEKEIATEKTALSSGRKNRAGGKIQQLIAQRADIIAQTDTEKLSEPERTIFTKLHRVNYAIGSKGAQSTQPQGTQSTQPQGAQSTQPKNFSGSRFRP